MYRKILFDLVHKTNPQLFKTASQVHHGGRLTSWRAVTSSANNAQHGVLQVEIASHLQHESLRSPDFNNHKDAFKHKTTWEVLRAYVIFKLSSMKIFVDHQNTILRLLRTCLGRRLFTFVMRHTLYGQFLAGDTRATVLGAGKRFKSYGVVPMYAYTAKEIHGIKGEGELNYDDPLWQTNFNALMDEITIAKESSEGGETVKMSGKYTFLVTHDIMESCTSVIDYQRKLIELCVGRDASLSSVPIHTPALNIPSQKVSECVRHALSGVREYAETMGLIAPDLPCSSTNIDSFTTNMATHMALLDSPDLASLLKEENLGVVRPTMNPQQRKEFSKLWIWLQKLAEEAERNNISILMDAEQTYLQLAMDNLALDLMRRYNRDRPVIHNTYQNYLKCTYSVVDRDFRMSEAEGFCLGLKPVRGGYMEEERQLAAAQGYPDPINDSYEATSEMYEKSARLILNKIQQSSPGRVQVTFATHNEATVLNIIKMMRDLNIVPHKNNIAFAQLLGMRDHIAGPLAEAGHTAHKLLHYGPVEQSVAYMSRRLQENRSGLATAGHERDLLGKELKRRMWNR